MKETSDKSEWSARATKTRRLIQPIANAVTGIGLLAGIAGICEATKEPPETRDTAIMKDATMLYPDELAALFKQESDLPIHFSELDKAWRAHNPDKPLTFIFYTFPINGEPRKRPSRYVLPVTEGSFDDHRHHLERIQQFVCDGDSHGVGTRSEHFYAPISMEKEILHSRAPHWSR